MKTGVYGYLILGGNNFSLLHYLLIKFLNLFLKYDFFCFQNNKCYFCENLKELSDNFSLFLRKEMLCFFMCLIITND